MELAHNLSKTTDFTKILEKSISEDNFSELLEEKSSKEEQSKYDLSQDEISDVNMIETSIKALKESTKLEIESQKLELEAFNKERILEKKQKYNEMLDLKKRLYEEELKEIENIQISYQKMEALADNLGFNTNLLNSISQKLRDTKENEENTKNSKILDFEKSLKERELRILSQEQQLEKNKIHVQENSENLLKIETERRNAFEQEEKKIKAEKEKLYQTFQLITQELQGKKQEIVKETHKIKILQENLAKRKEEVRKGVSSKLKQLEDFEELMISKHEETLRMINQERRQISEKREKIEDTRREIKIFEEKINSQTMIIERREHELNLEVEELIKNKNLLENQRALLENEMQSMHQLSLKLHTQSEEISRSKELLETETQYLMKMEEETETLKASSRNELSTAKEFCKQLDLKMKTYEKMSVNLIQDMHSSIIGNRY